MTRQLDPHARALLEVMEAVGNSQPYRLTVEDARARMRSALVAKGQPLELQSVEDVTLPAPCGPLTLRLYRPLSGALPVALFLHGGGWTVNDLDTHDGLCRRIARRSGWLLAALDYRRAPEHKHPAALEDALLAYRWLLDNGQRIGARRGPAAVIGESSGGTTAACLTLLLRDLGAPLPRLQVLAYPITDGREHWPSYAEHGDGYTLDGEFVRWSLNNYVPSGHDRRDPYLFPMAAQDLSGLPSTLVMTAEFDPLRDEGTAYADRLAAAGVEVEHIHANDQMHGFLLLDRAVPRAGGLIDRLSDALAAAEQGCSEGRGPD